VGAPANDSSPLWQRVVAAVITKIGNTRDVMAAGR
jgi:hypothetical protein